MSEAQATIVELQAKLPACEADVAAKRVVLDEADKRRAECDEVLAAHRARVDERQKNAETWLDAKHANAMKAMKNEAEMAEASKRIDTIAEEAQKFEKRLKELRRLHAWLVEDEELFGAAGTRYDFDAYGEKIKTLGDEYEKLKEEREALDRRIDKRAIAQRTELETQRNQLAAELNMLHSDKRTLHEAIAALDLKKKQEILTAYKKVRTDLDLIYSTLLPGTGATLQPVDEVDGDPLKGLRIRVAFNGVYKEALTELSGGQRSLVALSLVLAMLKYKPAPLYILDEVDAALDLSHTQNIGQMIKNHFKNSQVGQSVWIESSDLQFIIVSLKDGMFNNANVLFKTRFQDGRSTVSRTDNSKKKQVADR